MHALKIEIKNLIITALELEDLTPDDIEDSAPLFGAEGLGLDSIDALELGIALRKKYNLHITANDSENHKHFHSINTLAHFVQQHLQAH
ncbi:MAG: acyl carrier protein [Ottowia sp.]|jgi:acyl carrier protein|nr:acyl carrier protein [Ottowia sp.]